MSDKVNVKHVALAFVWRLVYEGLGLSGYSPRATAAMSVIDKAKSDSKKGFRVAKSIGLNPIQYNFAFKFEMDGEEKLDSKSWQLVSGPSELVRLLSDDTNITDDVAREMIKSATVLRTYKKLEQEGLASIGEKSGYFQYVHTGIITGALRRIGQGDTDSTVAQAMGSADEYGSDFDEGYDELTAPGMALTRLMRSYELAGKIKFDPLAELANKIAFAHEQIIIANDELQQQDNQENNYD